MLKLSFSFVGAVKGALVETAGCSPNSGLDVAAGGAEGSTGGFIGATEPKSGSLRLFAADSDVA